jgi:hypothetical protein
MAEGAPDHVRMFVNPELEQAARRTSFRELRSLPEPELVRRYDLLTQAEEFIYIRGPDDYLDELTRRETERQSRRLERLTWELVALTIVITVATLVLVWSELRH